MHGTLAIIASLEDLRSLLSNPLFLLLAAFQLWMLIHALRNGDFLWAVFIFVFPGINALLYYLLVYRHAATPLSGFELPGAYDRRRIRHLRAQIHLLDHAHHHLELGNILFQQGKLKDAASSFQAAIDRDPSDLEAPAHLGQCLLRLNRPGDALPLLQHVCQQDPHHEYGHTLMALAETQTALGQHQDALNTWQKVLERHAYARARIQYATLLAQSGHTTEARSQLTEAIADDNHAPGYQRRRDRRWIRRARSQLRSLPAAGR